MVVLSGIGNECSIFLLNDDREPIISQLPTVAGQFEIKLKSGVAAQTNLTGLSSQVFDAINQMLNVEPGQVAGFEIPAGSLSTQFFTVFGLTVIL